MAGDPTAFYLRRECVGLLAGGALMVAQDDLPLSDVANDAGGDAVDADKAQAAGDGLVWEVLREKFFVAETVLEGQESSLGIQQGRQKIEQRCIRRGLEGDDDEIAGADLPSGRVALDRVKMEAPQGAIDLQTVSFDRVVIRPHQEVDVVSMLGEPSAIVATYRSRTNDGDLLGAGSEVVGDDHEGWAD